MPRINTKPETQEYYKKALSIILKHGYIRGTVLSNIFKDMNMYSILLCFDRNENDLYDEMKLLPNIFKNGTKHGKKEFIIYKRLNPVRAKWRQEVGHIIKNGCMGPVGVNR